MARKFNKHSDTNNKLINKNKNLQCRCTYMDFYMMAFL